MQQLVDDRALTSTAIYWIMQTSPSASASSWRRLTALGPRPVICAGVWWVGRSSVCAVPEQTGPGTTVPHPAGQSYAKFSSSAVRSCNLTTVTQIIHFGACGVVTSPSVRDVWTHRFCVAQCNRTIHEISGTDHKCRWGLCV